MTFTELEQQILTSIKDGDTFDDVPTMCIDDLHDCTHVSKAILKRSLNVLVDKSIIQIGEYPNGAVAYHYIDAAGNIEPDTASDVLIEVSDWCATEFDAFLEELKKIKASGRNPKRLRNSHIKEQLKYFYSEYFSLIVNNHLLTYDNLQTVYSLVWPKGNLDNDIKKYVI